MNFELTREQQMIRELARDLRNRKLHRTPNMLTGRENFRLRHLKNGGARPLGDSVS